MLHSENPRLSGWVYFDVRRRDLKSAVQEMQRIAAQKAGGMISTPLLSILIVPAVNFLLQQRRA